MKQSTRTIATDIFGLTIGPPRINSKDKGNRNELALAKQLSSWTGEQFNRVPSSGGLRWQDASLIAGDVVAPVRSSFPFSVETKHLKSLHVTKNLRANSEVFTIWEQARSDANRVHRLPLAFIRKNDMPAGSYYVFLSAGDFKLDWLDTVPRVCTGTTVAGEVIIGVMSKEVLEVPYLLFIQNLLTIPEHVK